MKTAYWTWPTTCHRKRRRPCWNWRWERLRNRPFLYLPGPTPSVTQTPCAASASCVTWKNWRRRWSILGRSGPSSSTLPNWVWWNETTTARPGFPAPLAPARLWWPCTGAAYLARTNPGSRILLTTFSDTLAKLLRAKLQLLIRQAPQNGGILVASLDVVALHLYEAELGPGKLASREIIAALVKDGTSATRTNFSPTFLMTEWERVVDAWLLDSWEAYRDITRIGRYRRLSEAQRKSLWPVFEHVRSGLRERGLLTKAQMFGLLTQEVARQEHPPFDHVVIDEAQDSEDGGVMGAVIYDQAAVRALSATGPWGISTSRAGVLRLAIEGSKRASGILASNYAQPRIDDKGTDDTSDDTGPHQEIISVGDKIGFGFELGAADRYLIRGVSFNSDDSTPTGSGFTNPFDLRSGSRTGTVQFSLTNTRKAPGLPVWTAPQGATVAGGCPTVMSVKTCKKYVFDQPVGEDTGDENTRRRDAVLFRVAGAVSDGVDDPAAAGVSFTGGKGDIALNDPLMAVLGVPLHAIVQNLGQANDGYRSVGGANRKVLSQGFTNGSNPYVLQGIGVNIEGSDSKFPDGPTSVSVAVHADSNGKPGAKLFDLVSPTEFEAGHSFFEAPPGTRLEGGTSYVMVWSHLGGTVHRMRKTGSNSEDSGALTGSSMANAFYQGVDLDNLAEDPGSDVLEMAVYSRSLPNATGRPIVLVSAEDAGVLAVDTSGIGDPDGIPNVGGLELTGILHDFSYRWIRVDGDTETVVSAGSGDYRQIDSALPDSIESGRYRRVEADIGKLIKVQVSFIDGVGARETVTSLPCGPLARLPSLPTTTLVSNTGQSASATAMITGRYDMGFRLGNHGQGYEISSVSIELAAAPSSLTVSLWMGRAPGRPGTQNAQTKLFDFESPSSFEAGLNRFTAPAGAFAYQNVDYFIVLSDFGASLSIKETTSNDEDAGGDTGAALYNRAGGDSSVLRLAVEGSKRAYGILASSYAQDFGPQEISSLGDDFRIPITLGAADRYLIRGVSYSADNTSNGGGGFTHPFDLLDGTTELFRLINTRQINGINEWTAPQGATVAGGCTTDAVTMVETCETYNFKAEVVHPVSEHRYGGVVLTRLFGTESTTEDSPSAAGVSLASPTGDVTITRLLMAVFGKPLVAMVQNLGRNNNSYAGANSTNPVLSQGFTTGPDASGYELTGIGVNIEGSGSELPDGPRSVSVAVHADSSGKPGEKLFDLVSPTEYAAGHSFFEAPPGTTLAASTSYVLVWRYVSGAAHRLQRTLINGEDPGALTGFSIADEFYRGRRPEQPVRGLRQQCIGNRGVHRGLHEGALRGGRYPGDPELAPHTGGRRCGVPVQGALRHTSRQAPDVRGHRRVQHLGPVGSRAGIQRSHHSGRLQGYQGGGLHRWGRRANEHRDDGRRRAGPLAGRGLGGPPHAGRQLERRVLRLHVGEHRLRRLCHRELRPFRRPCHGLDRVRRLWSRTSGFPHGRQLSHGHGRRGHTERSLTENERRGREFQFRSSWRRRCR